MLKNDAIYNLLFRFRDINFNNVNDIYFAINIVIIATTLFETFIALFVFKFIIIIVFNVNIVVIIAIVIFVVVFKKFIFKLIAFDLDIKNCFTINALFDKF